MDDTLSHFAQATGHRIHRIETKAQVDQLRRKLVVTQSPLAVEHVYPFVDEDYQAIEFRAPGVMASYQVDPKYLETIMDSVELNKKAPGFHEAKATLDEFVDQVQPPVGKELYTFMSCSRNPHEKLKHFEDYPNLINRVKTYVAQHANANQHVGQLIAAMTWPNVEETLKEHQPLEEEEEPKERLPADPLPLFKRNDEKKVLPIEAEPKVWNEDEMREIPAIKQYKLDAGIRGRFPSDKVVTQMLVQSNAFPHIMGKTQTEVPTLEKLDEICFNMADYYPKDLVEAIVATDQAQDLYYALHDKPTDGRELVRTLLKGPEPSQVHKRYGRQYDNGLTNEVKQQLVKFH